MPEAPCWFWAKSGAVHVLDTSEVLAHARPFEVELEPTSPPRWESLEKALDSPEARANVFFSVLHGGAGEDGTVQGFLEERKLAFVGSSAQASRNAMNKWRAKALVKQQGIRVAEGEIVIEPARIEEKLRGLLERHRRLVVKPVSEGSTVGVVFVAAPEDVARAAEAVKKSFPGGYLVEAFVSGCELTVGVLDDERGIRPLPCSEVRLEAGRQFDYEGKYLGRGTTEITPAEVPESVSKEAQDVAVRAHEILGCSGYTRTDVIVDERGPVFLELNTLPGLSKASFYPQQLEAAGISMESFLEGQLARARRRSA